MEPGIRHVNLLFVVLLAFCLGSFAMAEGVPTRRVEREAFQAAMREFARSHPEFREAHDRVEATRDRQEELARDLRRLERRVGPWVRWERDEYLVEYTSAGRPGRAAPGGGWRRLEEELDRQTRRMHYWESDPFYDATVILGVDDLSKTRRFRRFRRARRYAEQARRRVEELQNLKARHEQELLEAEQKAAEAEAAHERAVEQFEEMSEPYREKFQEIYDQHYVVELEKARRAAERAEREVQTRREALIEQWAPPREYAWVQGGEERHRIRLLEDNTVHGLPSEARWERDTGSLIVLVSDRTWAFRPLGGDRFLGRLVEDEEEPGSGRVVLLPVEPGRPGADG